MLNVGHDAPPITELLRQWRGGDRNALSELTNYVYNDLRRRASACLRGDVQATPFKRPASSTRQ